MRSKNPAPFPSLPLGPFLKHVCTIDQLARFLDEAPPQLPQFVLSKLNDAGKAEIDKALSEYRSKTKNDWELTEAKFIALVTLIERLQGRRKLEEREAWVTTILEHLQRERAAWPLFQLDVKRGLYRWIGPSPDASKGGVDI